MDPLRNAHELPDDIRRTLDMLVIDRCGDDPQSFMVTEDIVGHVAPGASYRLDPDRLTRLDGGAAPAAPTPRVEAGAPPHVRPAGVWNPKEEVAGANIFGGLGTLTLPAADLVIPEAPASAAALGFYGARPFSVGDVVVFEGDRNLAVTITNFGPAYADGYVHVEDRGGGAFIEYHDQPHLHMPLDPAAYGHILLGRADGDDYLLSAFAIPHGHAIYSPPLALHADPYLVGRFLVVYAVTETYSTVVFRSPEGALVKPTIRKA